MANLPVIIIITGPGAASKTTLGHFLAKEFELPFIHKDGIKEILYDSQLHSTNDVANLGFVSAKLLLYFAQSLISAGQDVVVEASFDPELATREFLEMKRKVDFAPFQIQCVASGEVLVQRFKSRMGSASRHPSHDDEAILKRDREVFEKGRSPKLDIGGKVYELDTTDFSRIDYDKLIGDIATTLNDRIEIN